MDMKHTKLEASTLCFGASLSGILTAGIVLEAIEAEDSERSVSTEEAPELSLSSALSVASLSASCISRWAHGSVTQSQPVSASTVQLEGFRK